MASPGKSESLLDEGALRDMLPNRRYLIGVSGGRDSVALLHELLAHGYRKLIVCHLNHGLRGRASLADAQFVQRLTEKAGLVWEHHSLDLKARAAAKKQSIETAARAARYEFFAAVSRRRRCAQIVLGHHADDLVETFLFNLFRGAGTEGLSAMRSVSFHQVEKTKLTVIRPLLGVWREEIDEFVASNRVKFRDDLTNRSLAATRNRLRHRIVPLLEKEFGRAIRRSIWRAAMIAAEENDVLEKTVPGSLRAAANLPVSELAKLPLALQRRVIRAWLHHHGVRNVDFELIENARALIDPKLGSAKINLPSNRHARRRSGELFIE